MKEIIIYTVDYCGYCKKAKSLLDKLNLKYKEIDITDNEKEYRKQLGEYYAIKEPVTVPQIIIGGRRIGGFDKLQEYYQNGMLDKLIEE